MIVYRNPMLIAKIKEDRKSHKKNATIAANEVAVSVNPMKNICWIDSVEEHSYNFEVIKLCS